MTDDSLPQPRRAAYNVLVAAASASLLACWSDFRLDRGHAISFYAGKLGVKGTVRSMACLRGDRVTNLSNADVSSNVREVERTGAARWRVGQ